MQKSDRLLGARLVQIDLHGGEPLLMKKHRFRELCSTLHSTISEVATVKIGVQTNAMLVDEDWISIFEEFRIGVGVSIDGDRETHDRYRLDHNGRGTYDRTVRGLRLLQEARRSRQRLPEVAVLAVADFASDPVATFRHLVDDLEFRFIHLLLPDYDRDDVAGRLVAQRAQRFLLGFYRAWVSRRDPSIAVRLFSNTLPVLADRSVVAARGTQGKAIAFTVSSDGDLDPPDDLRNVLKSEFGLGPNVRDTALADFAMNSRFAHILTTSAAIPTDCGSCALKTACYNGLQQTQSPVHRFSKKRGFDNPSLYWLQAMSRSLLNA